ncbi:XdhC family protein [Paraburkholderia sartisoli]|uniref:Xanthine dehydrogenase accessory factor n=1 Tax=Paraburkholderia sartisoli TaxID=83784 RepID=A0A1H4CM25_9BURK|nr:XdhC family protein [Paraburkholderia sartisoli]SEA61363.1 xanthine dehydrogenase accessory factor [Paraburkholderia sartisoli]
MESVDVAVLQHCIDWRAQGRRVVLVTVTRTWGSSPRPVGAMLALRDDGVVCGSVSGGCIEDDLIDRTRRCLMTGERPEVVTYGISAEEARRFGLPCGGTMQLVLEPLSGPAGPEDLGGLGELARRVAAGELVARELDLASGRSFIRPALSNEQLRFDGRTLMTVHGPRYRLLIIGAGDLSRFLASMASALGYQVTVCDPRDEYLAAWDVPNVRLVRTMPDDTVLDMRLDAHSAVVALTHDPKLDDLALMDALKTDAFYVAAIGSRANSGKRRERLKLFDVTDAQLARLHGPAGIFIGSRTPPEIAVSIAAEMTAARNGVPLPAALDIAQTKDASENLHLCPALANAA